MGKQTNYELLKDVHAAVNRLEDKMDKRMVGMERRMDDQEAKTDNLVGKIGIGVMVLSSAIGLTLNAIYDFFRNK